MRALLTFLRRLSRTRHQQLLDIIIAKKSVPGTQLSTSSISATSTEVDKSQEYQQALYASPLGVNQDSVRSPEHYPFNGFGFEKSEATPTSWTKQSLGHLSQNYLFGSLEIKSWLHFLQNGPTRRLPTDDFKAQCGYQTSITFRPAEWLVKFGAKYGFHACIVNDFTQGWQHKLETFCPVPDNSPIFHLCSTGNLAAVRDLLSAGHASVRDTDSLGRTPLHVSARVTEYPTHNPMSRV